MGAEIRQEMAMVGSEIRREMLPMRLALSTEIALREKNQRVIVNC
jgi:hypothetical protein